METPNQDEVILQILMSGDEYAHLLRLPLLEAVRQIGQGLPVSASLKDQLLDDFMELRQEPPCTVMEDTIAEIVRGVTDAGVARSLSERLLELPAPHNHWDALDLAHLLNVAGNNEQATSVLRTDLQTVIDDIGDEFDLVETLQMLLAIGRSDIAAPRLLEIGVEESMEEAIVALGTISSPAPEIVQSLLEFAQEGTDDQNLRIAAVNSLIRLGEEELARPILSEIVLDAGIDPSDRRRAAKLLGEIGEKEFALDCARNMLSDAETETVTAIKIAADIAALGHREEGTNWLMQAAAANVCCGVCGEISCSLGRELIVTRLLELDEKQKAAFVLIEALEAQVLDNRGKAAHAAYLARIGEVKIATRYLLEVIRSSAPSDSAYDSAIVALGAWGDRTPEVFELLFSAAREIAPESKVYWRVLEALGNFGNNAPEVMEFLAQIAREHPGTFQARSAYGALWSLAHT